jgi:hypothetical protein
MSLAITVRAMVDAGCTAEQVAAVVGAHEGETEKKRAAKRAQNAARQRRFRVTHRNADNALRDVSARYECDPLKETPHTPQETTPQDITPVGPNGPTSPDRGDEPVAAGEKSAQARARARGSRLPDEWVPSEALVAFAGGLGFAGHGLDEAVAEFGDYWRARPGPNARKLDWEATFKNRLRSIAGRRKGNAHGNGKRGAISDIAPGFIKRIDEQFAYLDDVRPAHVGAEGGPTVRVLPTQRGK